ncbi:MAG: TatD family hydrolase [Candidatus Hodarchaeales archaeon]|jgi:TatD DNase family protein
MSDYIDVHCHLPVNYFYKSIDSYIKSWKEIGLTYIVSVSQNHMESLRSIELANKYEFIVPAIGIHPWKAHKKHNELEKLKDLLIKNKKVKILGEIGLDKHFIKEKDRYPFQVKVLDYFFELAGEGGYRLMLHIKGAENEIIYKIETSSISGQDCCIHWFSGSKNQLNKLIDLDCYFSCGPALKYSQKHRQVPKMIPIERLLTESDGNVKYQGQIGHPGLIPQVINQLASLTKQSKKEIKENVLDKLRKTF